MLGREHLMLDKGLILQEGPDAGLRPDAGGGPYAGLGLTLGWEHLMLD